MALRGEIEDINGLVEALASKLNASYLSIGIVSLPANVPTVIDFTNAFPSIPAVAILRITDLAGIQIGGVVDISGITTINFTATAIEDCVLTYLCGKPV